MIIDASVAVKWFALEDGSERAVSLLDGRDLYAPTLIMSEVANAFWKMARSAEIDAKVSFAADIARLPDYLEVLNETSVIPRALQIARQFGHPVYDCVYLALAERRGEPLVTADYKFLKRLDGSSLRQLCLPLGDLA